MQKDLTPVSYHSLRDQPRYSVALVKTREPTARAMGPSVSLGMADRSSVLCDRQSSLPSDRVINLFNLDPRGTSPHYWKMSVSHQSGFEDSYRRS
ncbi:hypothetical protein BaRGS_00010548 [Batillaria attramentaria]|uniref:Uncharacterized protein n=1 Tax=Batillaria attramentaria TaxID=370345 RepID=A0ABD0LGP0_9CAEN